MTEIINHPTYGQIIYTEGFWTGKKTLTVNGAAAQKVSRKEFMIGSEKATLGGNFYSGVKLQIGNETVQLTPCSKWYEYVLSFLPLFFLLTWGNSPSLCLVFPVIGGALGGALGACASCVSIFFMKKVASPIFKILIGIASLLATILIAFLLALIVISIRF